MEDTNHGAKEERQMVVDRGNSSIYTEAQETRESQADRNATSKQGEQGDDFSSGSRDETRMCMGLEVLKWWWLGRCGNGMVEWVHPPTVETRHASLDTRTLLTHYGPLWQDMVAAFKRFLK
ncbi:unnamed protein product [Fusarium graminearum]|nr:unnamed protein product [Fusarium graminearum]